MLSSEQRGNLARIAAAAVVSERESGCPAELTAAQCIIESGWLKHAPGNNPFGIKRARRHECAQTVATQECVDGEMFTVQAEFAVFRSLAEAFTDHGRLIREGAPYREAFERYQRGLDLECLALEVAHRYATDGGYGPKILSLMRRADVRAAIAVARGGGNANS